MEVEMWPAGRLKPYPGNPRRNDTGVAASRREFGSPQPIVVDGADVIVVGYTRYKAAFRLGLAEGPVHVARGLEEKVAALDRPGHGEARW